MTNRWTWLLSERYSVDWLALLVLRAGCRLFCWKRQIKMHEKLTARHDDSASLTCPFLLIFFASSIRRCGIIQRLSVCEMSTLLSWQHCAAIRTWAEMSFLSVGWTKRGGKNDGAVIVATLWIDILLKLCRSTTSLKKLRSSRSVLRFSWGKRRHNIEIARAWSWAGRAGWRKIEIISHHSECRTWLAFVSSRKFFVYNVMS